MAGTPLPPLQQPKRVDTAPMQKIIADEIQIGAGERTFRANAEGVWSGGEDFESATFRIYYDGKVIIGNGASEEIVIDPSTNTMTFGGQQLFFDASVPEMVLNDGTNDRIHIGYLPGKY